MVKDIRPGPRPCAASKRACRGQGASSYPSELTAVGKTLYFTADDGMHGVELWRSNGTARGTRMVKDIRPGKASTGLGSFAAVGRTLYFTANDGIHGEELCRSNGTARGTRLVKDISPGPDTSFIQQLTDVAGALFFVVDGHQLWRSDGTATGTVLLKELGLSKIGLTAVGSVLYFPADDGIHGEELWRSDGRPAGTRMVADINATPPPPAQQGSGPFWLTDVAGTLLFTATDGTHYGVWRSDGTEAGTALVKQGVGFDLTAVGRTLYFTSGFSGSLLWRSNGTEAGTIPLTNVGPTPEGDGFYPQLTGVGRTLFFVRNEMFGTLLRTHGTLSGTKLLPGQSPPRVADRRREHPLLRRHGPQTRPGALAKQWHASGDPAGPGHPARWGQCPSAGAHRRRQDALLQRPSQPPRLRAVEGRAANAQALAGPGLELAHPLAKDPPAALILVHQDG